MKNLDINELLNNLSVSERVLLLDKLKTLVFGDKTKDNTSISACPCCNEIKIIKYGSYNNTPKYKCKTTNKIFTYRSKTILSGISNTYLGKLEELLTLMVNKKIPTITEIQYKLKICRQTAFDWRTKIITAIYKEVCLDNQLIEFDETNFRLSRKGRKGLVYGRKNGKKIVGDNPYNVKVFISYSRTNKKLELLVSHMGRSKGEDINNYLGSKKELVIYSDKHPSYKKVFKDNGFDFQTFKSSDHILKTNNDVHNQTINYHCGNLQKILNDDLKGVSTKYLQGYLNWYMFIENTKNESSQIKETVIENKIGYDIFKQKEKEFKYFLRNNGRTDYGVFKDRYYKNVA